jgi:hypothetical protein
VAIVLACDQVVDLVAEPLAAQLDKRQVPSHSRQERREGRPCGVPWPSRSRQTTG